MPVIKRSRVIDDADAFQPFRFRTSMSVSRQERSMLEFLRELNSLSEERLVIERSKDTWVITMIGSGQIAVGQGRTFDAAWESIL